MNTMLLITQSEYLRRIRSKAFILATVLAPLLIVGVFGAGALIGVMAQDGAEREVAILDHTGEVGATLAAALPARFRAEVAAIPEDSLRARVRRGDLDGFFVLPEGLLDGTAEATYISEQGGGGFTGQMLLQEVLSGVVRQARLRSIGAPDEVFAVLDGSVNLRTVVLTETGDAADASWLYAGLGYVMGFVIYMAMLLYGAMVMRGVIEEKSNRIVEIIASSARPFDLMMGKVLGIGMAGLTQFIVWAAMLAAVVAMAGALFVGSVDPAMVEEAGMAGLSSLTMPPISIFVYFILFFFGGYLLYASLFAAVGSAVESEADAQSMQMLVLIPVMLPVLALPLVADNPDATISVVLSLLPLFSPVLMPVRIAAGTTPFWQIAASIGLLILGFLLAIWVAARIYRIGILMYGKRASLRDLVRWARQS
ncbi:ABC transporter permease [soil metagenome]